MGRSRRLGWSVAGAAALVVSPLAAWAGLDAPAVVGAPAVPGNAAAAPRIEPSLLDALEEGAASDLLVFVHGTTLRGAAGAVADAGLDPVTTWDRIGVVVASGSPDQVRAVAADDRVTFVERDQELSFSLETSQQATRYDQVLATNYTVERTAPPTTPGEDDGRGKGTVRKPARPGGTVTEALPTLDGTGVSIAVVDSGIDGTHPLFNRDGQSKVVVNKKLVTAPCAVVVFVDTPAPCTGTREDGGGADKVPSTWVDMDDTDTPSNGGHGTHVAGIAAAYPSDTRELHGSAPGAKLVGLSVGQVISVYGGNQGLNWVLENHAAPCGREVPASICPPIKVVNNSYGGADGAYDEEVPDATAKLQDALVAAGVTVVWAAGNSGGDGSAVNTHPPTGSPTPGVISVANYDDADSGTRDGELAASSSRGKRGEPKTYPDVAAPGSAITSACRITLPVCTSGDTDPDYGTIGGTSMAAPHVAGYTAVLQQASMAAKGRWLSPGEIEDLLEDTAYKFVAGGAYEADLPERNADDTTSFDKGHGLVDVKAAVATLLGAPLGEPDPTPPPGLACVAGDPVVTDPEGDATSAVLVGVAPNEPALDLRAGNVIDAGDDLAFTIRVSDLGEDNPSTAPQISYNTYFTYDGLEWYVDAGRGATGAESFSFGLASSVDAEVTSAAVRAPLALITGSFDAATDTVTMVLPKSLLSSESGTPVGPASVLDGFQLHARRAYTTTPITQGAAADDAVGFCSFTVPGAPEPVEPTPTDYTPPAPEGTVAKGQTLTFAGGPKTDAQILGGIDETVLGPCDVTAFGCDVRGFQVEPGTGSTLTVRITGDAGAVDLDLYVLDPDGVEVGRSATTEATETVSAPVTKAGVYTVRVVWYVAVEGGYTGSIGLA